MKEFRVPSGFVVQIIRGADPRQDEDRAYVYNRRTTKDSVPLVILSASDINSIVEALAGPTFELCVFCRMELAPGQGYGFTSVASPFAACMTCRAKYFPEMPHL